MIENASQKAEDKSLETLRGHHWLIQELVTVTDTIVLVMTSLSMIDSVTFSIVMVYVLAKGSDEIGQLGFMYIVTFLYGIVMVLCLGCAAVVKSSVSIDQIYSFIINLFI